MKVWLFGEIPIVILTVLLWIGAGQSEDARAGYKGSEMMGELMSVVVGVMLSLVWTAFALGETAISTWFRR